MFKTNSSLSRKVTRLAITCIVSFGILAVAGLGAIPSPSSNSYCADKVVAQVTSSKTILGAWECLGPDLQFQLGMQRGVTNDDRFAATVGIDGTWQYVGTANDGRLLYEVNQNGAITSYSIRLDSKGRVAEVG